MDSSSSTIESRKKGCVILRDCRVGPCSIQISSDEVATKQTHTVLGLLVLNTRVEEPCSPLQPPLCLIAFGQQPSRRRGTPETRISTLCQFHQRRYRVLSKHLKTPLPPRRSFRGHSPKNLRDPPVDSTGLAPKATLTAEVGTRLHIARGLGTRSWPRNSVPMVVRDVSLLSLQFPMESLFSTH